MGLWKNIKKAFAPKPKPVKVIRPASHPVPKPPVSRTPPASRPVDVKRSDKVRELKDDSLTRSFDRITKDWTIQQWKVWRSFAGTNRDPELAQDFYDGYIDPNPPGGKSRRVKARKNLKYRLRNKYGFSPHAFSNEFDWEAWKMENEGSLRES